MGKISELYEGVQHNGYWVSNMSAYDIIMDYGFDNFMNDLVEYRVPKQHNNRQVFNRRNNDGNTYFSTDITTDNACLIWVYDSDGYTVSPYIDYGTNEEYIEQKCNYAQLTQLRNVRLCEIEYDRVLLYFKAMGYYKVEENLSTNMFQSFDESYNAFTTHDNYICEQLGFSVYTPIDGDSETNNTVRELNKKINPIFIERTNINGNDYLTYSTFGNSMTEDYMYIPTAMTTSWYQGRRNTPFSFDFGRDYNNTFTQGNYPNVQSNSNFIICPDIGGEWYGTPTGFLLWKGSYSRAWNLNTTYYEPRIIEGLPEGLEASFWSMLTREAIENICYSFGLQWTGNINKATNATIGQECIDPDIHIAKISDYGVTDQYYNGSDIGRLPYMQGSNIDFKQSNVFKYKNDQNDYDDIKNKGKSDGNNASMDVSIPTLNPMSAFNTSYVINYNNLKNFAKWIWNADDSTFSKIVSNATIYNNPIDCIIGCKMYPFDVEKHHSAGLDITEHISLGRVKSPLFAKPILPNYDCIIDMGSVGLNKTFDSFLDYEPYSNYYLYIPYCGTFEINSLNYIGKTIKIKMVVDISTGSCVACVYGNNLLLDQYNGHIAVDVPISTMDKFSLAEQQVRGKENTANNIIGSIASFATGNIVGGITGLINAGESEINNSMLKPDISKGATSTPMSANYLPQKCYIIVSNPKPLTPKTYGRDIGYVCNKSYQLNQLEGFTKVQNPIIEFAIDESEKNELINLLISGIYIKRR